MKGGFSVVRVPHSQTTTSASNVIPRSHLLFLSGPRLPVFVQICGLLCGLGRIQCRCERSITWILRCQRAEVEGRRSEVRGRRSEGRGQRSEVGGQRSEVRGQRSEVGGQRSEVG